jgi:citrate lyase subunit beta/citryl-CoA lyase
VPPPGLDADAAALAHDPENVRQENESAVAIEAGFALMRSLLFVPADGGRKLDKALDSGADAVIVDLEDSIANDRKAAARASAASFLAEATKQAARPRLIVRVNGLATGLTDADLDALVPARPDAIMLPKADGGRAVVHADAKLAAREAMNGISDGAIAILAMAFETAASLFLGGTFAGVSERLIGLSWGAEDLATEIGAETNRTDAGGYREPYRLARTLCLATAATAGVQAIETIYMDYRDAAGLARDSEEARRDGFTGRLAIHPAQVPIINEVFTPSAAALAQARAIIAAFTANPGAGVVGIEGVMYDRPHLARAQRLLARADKANR